MITKSKYMPYVAYERNGLTFHLCGDMEVNKFLRNMPLGISIISFG